MDRILKCAVLYCDPVCFSVLLTHFIILENLSILDLATVTSEQEELHTSVF